MEPLHLFVYISEYTDEYTMLNHDNCFGGKNRERTAGAYFRNSDWWYRNGLPEENMNLKNGGNQPGREKRKSSIHREYFYKDSEQRAFGAFWGLKEASMTEAWLMCALG